MNQWVSYKNGNYKVLINLNNGTKIRYNKENELIPDRPESMDIKISNLCSRNCLFCHENSNLAGKIATIETLENFADTILPYTECSIGGGNLIESPYKTEYFLKLLTQHKAISSITIHQQDFLENQKLIEEWINKKYVYGIGISVNNPKDEILHELLPKFNNAVIHTIAGIYDEEYYKSLMDKDYKMLILGYKNFRRGKIYYNNFSKEIDKNIVWLSDNIMELGKHFKVTSFDNLALEQLKIQEKVESNIWNNFYCGDDGKYTFYVDLVEKIYGKNSTSTERFPIDGKTQIEMFNHIKSIK